MEILETERSFVQSLEQCITRYLKVLRGPRADVLPPESVDKLFGNLEDVFQHNRRFLHLLEGQMNNWTEQTRIGATFDCYWEGYTTQIYSEYANNCDEAIALYYSLLEGTPAFRAFVQEVQKAGGMDLASYLIMPIQRLPRYMLLLQRLLQATPHMHPDVSNIQRAYTSAKAVTDDINTRKKRSEEMKKLKQVADSIDGLPPNVCAHTPTSGHSTSHMQEAHNDCAFATAQHCRAEAVPHQEGQRRGPRRQAAHAVSVCPQAHHLHINLGEKTATD